MPARLVFVILSASLSLSAQNIDGLPDWAQAPAQEGMRAKPPADADAWVLLERTEFAYTGSGDMRQHHYRLVRILTERGLGEGVYKIYGFGGKANRIKRLKGWNCRPDGEVTKLDQDNVVTMNLDRANELTTRTGTAAVLTRVVKGSLVAFESMEIQHLVVGLAASAFPMEEHPVRCWELELAKAGGWFSDLKEVQMHLETRHFRPWLGLDDFKEGTKLALRDVPPLPKDEGQTPAPEDVLPNVFLRFVDPGQTSLMGVDSWDAIARWEVARYLQSSPPLRLPGTESKPSLQELQRLKSWIARQITYKMVYLTPDRGWVPEVAEEVFRKRYGDCKDMASLFIAASRSAGFEAFPVLARIFEGRISADDPVGPQAFNHVIAAVRLPASLGLPAEVETPRGRFLLVDPTDAFTSLGRMAEPHRGRRVMLCLPEGAQWVVVPTSAIVRPGLTTRLEGRLEADGRLKAHLTLQETGNSVGLRSTFAEGSEADRKRFLSRLLEFPLDGRWSLNEASDPHDLENPMRLTLELDFPKALRHEGHERVFSTFLFPAAPAPIQRPGKPRRYPVEWASNYRMDLEARLELPEGLDVHPALSDYKEDNAFRVWNWRSNVSRGVWSFAFSQEGKDAAFGFDHREDGVREAKQDRSHYLGFLGDAPALILSH
jgi:Transglutaminase-like superfamily